MRTNKQSETDPALFDPDKYRGEDLLFGGGKFPKGDAPEWARMEPVKLKTILKRRKTKKRNTFAV